MKKTATGATAPTQGKPRLRLVKIDLRILNRNMIEEFSLLMQITGQNDTPRLLARMLDLSKENLTAREQSLFSMLLMFFLDIEKERFKIEVEQYKPMSRKIHDEMMRFQIYMDNRLGRG
jgi:hypothetical protein